MRDESDFHDSLMTLDERAADHFDYTSQNDEVWLAVSDHFVHAMFVPRGISQVLFVSRCMYDVKVSFPATLQWPGTSDADS
jgi:hypothetical protein